MNREKEKWISVGITISACSLVVVLLTAFSVNVLRDYGYVLFLLVPLGSGIASTTLYGYFRQRTWRQSLKISFLTLAISCILLFFLYIEGILCIIMASPVFAFFQFIGTLIGHTIQSRNKSRPLQIFAFNFLLIPLMFLEGSVVEKEGGMIKVSSSVIIDASIEEVWKQVVAFPEIPEPDDWFFKSGIAYPISSSIVGEEENAIRYCEFTTGAFVEPITTWQEPTLLQFSVEEQPVPFKEMLVDEVPGNMYKYFVSTKGEFKLSELGNGQTLLVGTTWYYHKIRPVEYWQLWSDLIIHKIHYRVLNHIKNVSENN